MEYAKTEECARDALAIGFIFYILCCSRLPANMSSSMGGYNEQTSEINAFLEQVKNEEIPNLSSEGKCV